jgi:hypothetical protein
MISKERLQIALDLSPFGANQLIKSVAINDKHITITALEPSGRGCTMVESTWSMPVRYNVSDDIEEKETHTLG